MDYMGVKIDEDFRVILLGKTVFYEQGLVVIIKENGEPVLMEEGMAVNMFGYENIVNRVVNR